MILHKTFPIVVTEYVLKGLTIDHWFCSGNGVSMTDTVSSSCSAELDWAAVAHSGHSEHVRPRFTHQTGSGHLAVGQAVWKHQEVFLLFTDSQLSGRRTHVLYKKSRQNRSGQVSKTTPHSSARRRSRDKVGGTWRKVQLTVRQVRLIWAQPKRSKRRWTLASLQRINLSPFARVPGSQPCRSLMGVTIIISAEGDTEARSGEDTTTSTTSTTITKKYNMNNLYL